ncbi:hypothetical protein EU537_00635 [Candidatus Thorarchaeota archaeon]|nr:MAG: hypothetical protein EU537_00635 [Candidatus Thorarchaeota archaeon]
MPELSIKSDFSFKEPITGIELYDLTGDGRDNLILCTVEGNLRVYDFIDGEPIKLEEIARSDELAPIAAFDMGDTDGDGTPNIVVGGLDNKLRVLRFDEDSLIVEDCTPLGSLPTSLIVTNVMADDKKEVIVSTNDKALRCYGWFGGCLDKLAHKVVERPVFSMEALNSKGISYSRFAFGDDTGHVYIYQYQDDRLHEISKIQIKGEVTLVSTGNITGGRVDEIMGISNERDISLISAATKPLSVLARIHAPGKITSLRAGTFYHDGRSAGQMLVSQGDSKISILSYEGVQIYEDVTIQTAKKAVESKIAHGDTDGNGQTDIVQSVGNSIYLLTVET